MQLTIIVVFTEKLLMVSEIPKKNIFITGACGFVGKFLVNKILETTDKILILNCRNIGDRIFHSGRIVYSSVNLLNTASIEEAMLRFMPETIIHLAAITRLDEGEKRPDDAFQTNVVATKKLVESAAANQVRNFIFVSSDLARPPVSVVGITKYLAESILQQATHANLKQICIRLPNVSYSPGSVHLIFERLINEGKPLTITHPRMTRRFVSGEQAADFILFALKNGENKDIFVVDKKPEKIITLAENLIQSSGKTLTIDTIGIKPGEKLEEEVYSANELATTVQKNLSLLLNKPFSSRNINDVKQYLLLKPGFTKMKELKLL